MKSFDRIKQMTQKILLATFILLLSTTAQAGYLELGSSANYRRSTIDSENFQESISYTGSISYYFLESSALELSYTSGYSKIVVTPGDITTQYVTETDFSLTGLDLVFSVGGREDLFQPYLKIGGAYIQKKIYRQLNGFSKDKIGEQSGTVPSAGLGFKIKLSKTFSIKVGVDTWTSPLDEEPVTVDYAGRAGFSWFL